MKYDFYAKGDMWVWGRWEIDPRLVGQNKARWVSFVVVFGGGCFFVFCLFVFNFLIWCMRFVVSFWQKDCFRAFI